MKGIKILIFLIVELFVILLALALFLLALALIDGIQQSKIDGETTKCYDKYGNQIIGEKCIVENSFSSIKEKEIASWVFLILITIIGTLINFLFVRSSEF